MRPRLDCGRRPSSRWESFSYKLIASLKDDLVHEDTLKEGINLHAGRARCEEYLQHMEIFESKLGSDNAGVIHSREGQGGPKERTCNAGREQVAGHVALNVEVLFACCISEVETMIFGKAVPLGEC